MRTGFILEGVLTTTVMFGGLSFAANIGAVKPVNHNKINIQKTIDNVRMGKIVKAEIESVKQLSAYGIKINSNLLSV